MKMVAPVGLLLTVTEWVGRDSVTSIACALPSLRVTLRVTA